MEHHSFEKAADWDNRETEIIRMYYDEKRSLEAIRQEMKDAHGIAKT